MRLVSAAQFISFGWSQQSPTWQKRRYETPDLAGRLAGPTEGELTYRSFPALESRQPWPIYRQRFRFYLSPWMIMMDLSPVEREKAFHFFVMPGPG